MDNCNPGDTSGSIASAEDVAKLTFVPPITNVGNERLRIPSYDTAHVSVAGAGLMGEQNRLRSMR